MELILNDLSIFRSRKSKFLNLTDNVISVSVIICIVFVCGIVTYETSCNV